MHIPILGGYPLVLRSYDQKNPRTGELLYDYTNDKLYLVDKNNIKKDLAKDIYKKIIEARVQNTKINITKQSTDVSSQIPVIPPVASRKINNFYMNVQAVSERMQDIEQEEE